MDMQPTHEGAPIRVVGFTRSIQNGEPCLRVLGSKALGGGRFQEVVFTVGFERRLTTTEVARA